MPIRFIVDHTKAFVTAVVEGPVTLDEVLRHLDIERALKGLSYPELVDARTVELTFTASDVRVVVAWLRDASKHGPLGPTAVVVSTDVAFGMMRMLQMLVDDVCVIRPFRSLAEAEAWLDSGSAS
jgi:hypothetical protein